MGTKKITLVDSFIHQHFTHVYDEICEGVVNQRESRIGLDGIEDRKLKWRTNADKKEVLESIHTFFHLCLNAGKVGHDYEMIPEWIRAITKIACAQRSHGVVSSYKYRTLISSSEQITKFLFDCFDWGIRDIDVFQSSSLSKKDKQVQVSYLNSFDSRTWFYTHYKSDDRKIAEPRFFGADKDKYLWNTAQLLYAMKEQRNQAAHSAKNFYSNRTECLQRLVYQLYDHITVFFMVSKRCKEKDEDGNLRPILLRDNIKQIVNLPVFSPDINITIECVENSTRKKVLGREADIRLYKKDSQGVDTLVEPIQNNPSMFKVAYFDRYSVRMMTDGALSGSSEIFEIDKDFVDGSIVQVTVPPKGRPAPLSIWELILFSENDLPDDVRNLLTDMEAFAGQNEEYVKLARTLVLASATNNDRDKAAFENTVKQLEGSLKEELQKTMPQHITDFLQSSLDKIQKNMAEPYISREDFDQLCGAIDAVYNDMEELLGTSYDKDMPLVEQLYQNAKSFLDGNPLKVGTTATEEQLRVQRDLQNLEFLLTMREKYPDIIEAEFGSDWLRKEIENLYHKQLKKYDEDVLPLWRNVHALYTHLKVYKDSQNESERRAYEYAYLLYDVIMTSNEDILWAVRTCCNTLLYWIDKCNPASLEEVGRLQQKCKDEVNRLARDLTLMSQLPEITMKEGDKEFLEQILQLLRDSVNQLKNGIEPFRQMMDQTMNECWEKTRKRYGLFQYLLDKKRTPEETKEITPEVVFESFSHIVSNCSEPEQLMQMICCARIHPFFFSRNTHSVGGTDWLGNLGIRYKNLYEHEERDAYDKWVDSNKQIYDRCDDAVREICKRFSGRQRVNGQISDNAINDQKASQILEDQKRMISVNYDNQIPDYINDIIKARETELPNALKVKFLEKVLEPNPTNPTENLLFVIDAYIQSEIFCQGWRFLLGDYIYGDYAKRLVSPDGQDDFKKMDKSSQELYLLLLMNQDHPKFAGMTSGSRYMLAYSLNFPKEGSSQGIAIPRKKFFLLMSQFRLKGILSSDLPTFVDSYNVITIVMDYYVSLPEEESMMNGLTTYALPQLHAFLDVCRNYFTEHVQAKKVDEGKRPNLKIGFFDSSHKEMKGKSPVEQLAIKYESLYWSEFKDLRGKSGWCEVESGLFNDILNLLPDVSPKEQQETCRTLLRALVFLKMPFHNVIAERLMALKPFCQQEQFDKYLQYFYRNCIYHGLEIVNPSVIDGLRTIYNLFVQYGQNVKDTCGEPSWYYVAILINIHNILEFWDDFFHKNKAEK